MRYSERLLMSALRFPISSLVVTLLFNFSDCQKVVIVGGGVSGLSAAHHLWKNGIRDITVLEAESRLGGRINSEYFHGTLIEHGAQFIHGERNNPVYEIISKQSEVVKAKRTIAGDVFYTSNGIKIDAATQRSLLLCLQETIQKLDSYSDRHPLVLRQLTINEAGRKVWDKVLSKKNCLLDESLADATFNFIDNIWSIMAGQLTQNVSVLEDYYFEEQGHDYTIPAGYSKSLISYLVKDMPASVVKLGKKVTGIHWDRESENQDVTDRELDLNDILVESIDADNVVERIYADHVIVTVSLGVLQKYHHSMFIPQLPNHKKMALGRMGMGTVNKVFLYYQHGFWENDTCFNFILWNSNTWRGEYKADLHWFRHLYSIQHISNNSILFWMNAYSSEAVSDLSDSEIGVRLAFLLRRILRNTAIPDPDDVLVTRWHENVNFLGSYSYIPVGQRRHDRRLVSAPLAVNGRPRVLFAGEAMHRTRFSTVDGGYRTGVKESSRIIHLYAT